MAYSRILRRLREEKTNYRKRRTMLMGRRDFATVVISNQNTQVQVLHPEIAGDKVLASAPLQNAPQKRLEGFPKEHSRSVSDRIFGG